MSINLLCNNCKSPIGEASNDDNYENHYFYKNDKGQPICKTCGPGSNKNLSFIDFFIGLVIIISAVILSVMMVSLG